LAVPSTAAGVEREFSMSGRVATAGRAQLNPETITQVMMYKNHLLREGRPLQTCDKPQLRLGEEDQVDDQGVPVEWRDQWWETNVRIR